MPGSIVTECLFPRSQRATGRLSVLGERHKCLERAISLTVDTAVWSYLVDELRIPCERLGRPADAADSRRVTLQWGERQLLPGQPVS